MGQQKVWYGCPVPSSLCISWYVMLGLPMSLHSSVLLGRISSPGLMIAYGFRCVVVCGNWYLERSYLTGFLSRVFCVCSYRKEAIGWLSSE